MINAFIDKFCMNWFVLCAVYFACIVLYSLYTLAHVIDEFYNVSPAVHIILCIIGIRVDIFICTSNTVQSNLVKTNFMGPTCKICSHYYLSEVLIRIIIHVQYYSKPNRTRKVVCMHVL